MINLTNNRTYQATSDLLTNRVILVTGASSGIGKAVAITLAKHGATVILLGTNKQTLASTAQHIPQHHLVEFNLLHGNYAQYEQLAHDLTKRFGHIDGLLHNAGVLSGLYPIEHYPIIDWYKTMQINLNSRFMLTKCMLPLLKKSSDPSIVFTCATVARKPCAYWGAFAIASTANETLMQITSTEETNTSRIRANCLMLDRVNTKLRAKAFPAEQKKLLEPSDITHHYLFLLGPDSKNVTGECFTI